MSYKIAALVPMKGHSERVKNKNMRDFNGKPLMWHILNSLSECEVITEIYVDTDSELIAATVKHYFPEIRIIDRPQELCGDFVSMNDVLRYDISKSDADMFLQTHATNPLLSTATIEKACRNLVENKGKYDSLFSVNRLQTRLYDKAGTPMNHDPDNLIRTQDLDPIYEENSNIYLFTRESFLNSNARIGKKPMLFEMNPLEAVDIDDETDFILAEQLQKVMKF